MSVENAYPSLQDHLEGRRSYLWLQPLIPHSQHLQGLPLGTPVPSELSGQLTAGHEPAKKGLVIGTKADST
jgi:hypothetical protein